MMQANEEKVASLVGNLTKIMGQLAQEVGASSESATVSSEEDTKKPYTKMTCQACGHEEDCPECGDTEEKEAPKSTDDPMPENEDEEDQDMKQPSIIGRLMVLKKSKS